MSSKAEREDRVLTAIRDSKDFDIRLKAQIFAYLAEHSESGDVDAFVRVLFHSIGCTELFNETVNSFANDISDERIRDALGYIWSDDMLSDPTGKGETPPEERGIMALMGDSQGTGTFSSIVDFHFVRCMNDLSAEEFQSVQRIFNSGDKSSFVSKALVRGREKAVKSSIALVATFLCVTAVYEIRRWWKGEITGARCAVNITSVVAGGSGGLVGGYGGEVCGSALGALGGPAGAIIGGVAGAVVGGIVGHEVASTATNFLLRKFFNLPKKEALENAYCELGLTQHATNDEVNRRYRSLARKHHPDKGGDKDKFQEIAVAMEIIRNAREER